jgi:hypothetical protein
MLRIPTTCALVAACLLAGGGLAAADVKTDEKTAVKLEGMLGTMAGMFGGKAMKEGLVSTVAVKGDRRFRGDENMAEIVDLNEEKVYQVDLRKKTYTVMTFAEIRKRMEEARRKAEEQMAKSKPEQKAGPDEKGREMEMDFDIKETGQKRAINGFDCREVVMTVTVREKGKTLEQNGGLVLTSSQWLAPKIAALDEVAQFELRYAQKLAGPTMAAQAEQLAAALAMYPGIASAMNKLRTEGVKFDGTAIQTVSTFDAVASAEQQKQQAEAKSDEGSTPTGIGGLMGGLGRKMMKKKEPEGGAANATPGRARIMTMTNEVLKVTPSATAEDVAIPAGFKLKD